MDQLNKNLTEQFKAVIAKKRYEMKELRIYESQVRRIRHKGQCSGSRRKAHKIGGNSAVTTADNHEFSHCIQDAVREK